MSVKDYSYSYPSVSALDILIPKQAIFNQIPGEEGIKNYGFNRGKLYRVHKCFARRYNLQETEIFSTNEYKVRYGMSMY